MNTGFEAQLELSRPWSARAARARALLTLSCLAALLCLAGGCLYTTPFRPPALYGESSVLPWEKRKPEFAEAYAVPGKTYELDELEKHVGASPEVLPALAAMEEALAARDVENRLNGPKIFAGVSYSTNREPESVGSYRSVYYDSPGGRVGVSLPLLGTWARQRASIVESEARLLTARQLAESRRATALAALRSAYVFRWLERERRARLEAYLKDMDIAEAVMRERMEERLLLPADYEIFLGNIAMARRAYAESAFVETRARNVMRIAAGLDVPPEALAPPTLPRVKASEARMEDFIRRLHPEVHALEEAAVRLEKLPSAMALSVLDARVEAAYTPTSEIPGTTGDSFIVGLTVEAPLDFFRAGSAQKARAAAVARKAKRDAELHKERMLADLRVAVAAQHSALNNLAFAQKRLDAAAAAEKAARERHGELAGDTFEQHMRVRHDLLAAALNAYDVAGAVLRAQTEVLRVATDVGAACDELRDSSESLPGAPEMRRKSGPQAFALVLDGAARRNAQKNMARRNGSPIAGGPLFAMASSGPFSIPADEKSVRAGFAAPAASAPLKEDVEQKGKKRALSASDAADETGAQGRAPAAPAPPASADSSGARALAGRGAYVWDAAPFLDPARRAGELEAMRRAGMERMLISFNGGQLRALEGDRTELDALIRDARARGLAVLWLLGDPAWIKPEGRGELADLVRRFKDAPFDGLHLDLEPDQLPGVKAEHRAKLADELALTVVKAVRASPWPVGLSLHPRYVRAKGAAPWLLKDLAAAGVREVAVMAYSTNRGALLADMRGMAGRMAAYRAKKGAKRLFFTLAQSFERAEAADVSHYGKGRKAFDAWLEDISGELGADLDGMLVQAWEDYHTERK